MSAAQTQWVANLNPQQQISLRTTDQFAASTADGMIITTGFASDGDVVRLRIARLSSTGVEQWTRWAGSGSSAAQSLREPLMHADGSVTVSYVQSGNHCLENLAADGSRRMVKCFAVTSDAVAPRVTRTADDEIIFAVGSMQRTVRKLSRLGTQFWNAYGSTFTTNANWASGIDTAGNYVEVYGLTLFVWETATGQRIATAPLPASFRTNNLSWNSELVMRAGRDMVLLRDLNAAGATVTNVAVGRFAGTSVLRWSLNLSLPTARGAQSTVQLLAADDDGIYVAQTSNVAGGSSDVVKLSSDGVVLWQRNYPFVHRVVVNNGQLLAIRSDASASASDSYVFRIASATGDLDAPRIYSRDNNAAPSVWFPLATGVLAAFPGVEVAAEPDVASKQVFLAIDNATRWVYAQRADRAASVRQGSCLMPRLALSSPTGRWSRTQSAAANDSPSDWTAVASAGDVVSRTAVAALGCGPAVADDASRTIIASTPRAQRFDAAGAAMWTASSALVPSAGAPQPAQTLQPDGATTYQIGEIVGRVTASGNIDFESVLAAGLRPSYLAVDGGGIIWSVSSVAFPTTPVVTRLSPSGAVLSSTTLTGNGCTVEITAARLDANSTLTLATRDLCSGQAKLTRIATDGSVLWQRAFPGAGTRSKSLLNALSFDASGNVHAGGCAFDAISTAGSVDTRPVVVSWSATGSERWTIAADLIAGVKACVTSVAIDAGNDVLAAASPLPTTGSARSAVLWALSNAGAEIWRNGSVLASPSAQQTELLIEANGRLIALGEAVPTATSPRTATLRAADPAAIASGLSLRILSTPNDPIGFHLPFAVTVGIATADNQPAVHAIDTLVWLGVHAGDGNLDGEAQCLIPAGASSCTVSGARYDRVGTAVSLSVSADGFASVNTLPLAFVAAETSVALSPIVAGPYAAYSVLRIRASLIAPPPTPALTTPSTLTVPMRTNGVQTGENCSLSESLDRLPYRECDFLIRTQALPLIAYFNSDLESYYGSSASPQLTPAFAKQASLLQVTPDPANSYVAGDRVRFRVAVLLAASGFNASRFVGQAVTTAGGSCQSTVIAGNLYNGYAGSYLLCEFPSAPAGENSFSFNFSGDDDLFAATPVTVTATINTGAVFSRVGMPSLVTSTTACTLTAGVTCKIFGNPSPEIQCVGPAGMTGHVFLVPSPTGAYFYRGAPLAYNNVVGVDRANVSLSLIWPSSSCKLDVDADGAILATTDGMLALRAMLGLTGAALISDVVHACAPRDAAAIQNAITLSKFDLDGDGSTRAETDGILLLRLLLGIRGDALVRDALGANASRTTENEITSYLMSNCPY